MACLKNANNELRFVALCSHQQFLHSVPFLGCTLVAWFLQQRQLNSETIPELKKQWTFIPVLYFAAFKPTMAMNLKASKTLTHVSRFVSFPAENRVVCVFLLAFATNPKSPHFLKANAQIAINLHRKILLRAMELLQSKANSAHFVFGLDLCLTPRSRLCQHFDYWCVSNSKFDSFMRWSNSICSKVNNGDQIVWRCCNHSSKYSAQELCDCMSPWFLRNVCKQGNGWWIFCSI